MPSSVHRNFLWNASYQLLLVLAPLVTTPYLSRVLGAEQAGVYSYTYAITHYFVLFATLGMASYESAPSSWRWWRLLPLSASRSPRITLYT